MNNRKELFDTPLHVFDQIASLAPLCELLAKQKNSSEVEEVYKVFTKEQSNVFKSLPKLSTNRTVCRLNYVIGVTLDAHLNAENPTLSPSEVIISTLDFIEKTSSLTKDEIELLNDVPMENGLWSVEMTSIVLPYCELKKFNTEIVSIIQTKLEQSFNGFIGIVNNKSILSEERTKNTLCTDIAKRMVSAIDKTIDNQNPNNMELFSLAMVEFDKSINSYKDWINMLEREQ